MPAPMDLQGVHAVLKSAEVSVSPAEIEVDITAEVNGESEDLWTTLPVALDNCRLEDDTCDDNVGEVSEEFQQFVSDVSIEVAKGTDQSYRRYMLRFNKWLHLKKYLPSGKSIFDDALPESTPLLIIAWIMVQCDTIDPDGSSKGAKQSVSTYTHATKLRSALTYGFGRKLSRGNREWVLNKERSEWEGNPSVSIQVSRYMVALRKRKHAAGDRYAMSSRALTSDVVRRMYDYNQAEGRSDVRAFVPREKGKKSWGQARHRLLVHAVITLSMVCLLRIDEALNLRYEDIIIHSEDKIEISLRSRKTLPFGGGKPYYLWKFRSEMEALCPIRALAKWIQACGGPENCKGYIFRPPGSNGAAPASFQTNPISSSAFLELFRNNLLDIGVDGEMYGGHSCRRGGCQWLVRELRWPILRVCDWGGWSEDFSHSSIIKYLFSWNDNPYEPREDYFNPNRRPNALCLACGRSCWCGF